MGAYQLKIMIKGSKPPIWRRILVPEGITFDNMHQIIQTAYGWSGQSQYQFEFRSEKVRVISNDQDHSEKFLSITKDETIDKLVKNANKFTYTYKTEVPWEFSLQMEEVLEDYNEDFAKIIKFKGDNPFEGCGGLETYYKQLEEGAEGLTAFDMEAVNHNLKTGRSNESGSVHISDVYDCYDKGSIVEIAKRHELDGVSGLKKQDLAEKTIDFILDDNKMRSYFLCVRDSEIEMFEQVAAGSHKIPTSNIEELDFLYAGGYVTAGSNNDYMVADEVKTEYERINTPEFQEERRRLCKIGDYLCAANSLYAITPPSVLLETFNKYEEKKLTIPELMEGYERLLPYRCLVKFIDGNFIDAALVEQNRFVDLMRMQKKVPYYIPTEQEVRFMADNAGFLMSEELSQLSRFLTDEMNVPDEMIPYVLRQVQAEISLGGQLQEVIKDLEEAGILLDTSTHMEKFASIITDVWNHTRIVLNRGHKPYEMVIKGLEDVSSQRKDIQKIYPNEPCPCGSGKKYKKCCGKRS